MTGLTLRFIGGGDCLFRLRPLQFLHDFVNFCCEDWTEAMKKKNPDDPVDFRGELRGFITERFLSKAGLRSFSDEESFMEKGIIDSTGVLELVEFIEENFGVRVEDEEIIPDNLDSLDKVVTFLRGKTGHARL
jgi:acyl carrier protein